MRNQPYTEKGIGRVPCAKCGKSSNQQWQICSLGNKWVGICNKCDVDLNRLVLQFFGIKNRRNIMKRYLEKRKDE